MNIRITVIFVRLIYATTAVLLFGLIVYTLMLLFGGSKFKAIREANNRKTAIVIEKKQGTTSWVGQDGISYDTDNYYIYVNLGGHKDLEPITISKQDFLSLKKGDIVSLYEFHGDLFYKKNIDRKQSNLIVLIFEIIACVSVITIIHIKFKNCLPKENG